MKTVENTPDPQHYEQDSNQVKISRHYSMRPKTAYPPNCILLIYSDFLPSEHAAEVQKNLPGPGKYQTIDVIGTRYFTKSPNHFAKSFVGKDRFKSSGN